MEPRVIDYTSAFLKLNISGKRYKVLKSRALALHNSLFAELANLDEQAGTDPRSTQGLHLSPEAASSFYLIDTNEFYFERSSTVFDYALHYIYTGRLHCPGSICKDMLAEELLFWRVPGTDHKAELKVASCCVGDGKTEPAEPNGKTVEEDGDRVDHQPKTFLGKVWLCCEDPSSSTGASVSTRGTQSNVGTPDPL